MAFLGNYGGYPTNDNEFVYPTLHSNPTLLIKFICGGVASTTSYLKLSLYDFWPIGDLRGETFLGISMLSRKSGLLHFGSCISNKLQSARHIATY